MCIFGKFKLSQEIYLGSNKSVYSQAPISKDLIHPTPTPSTTIINITATTTTTTTTTQRYATRSRYRNITRKVLVIDLDETLVNSKYENLLYPIALSSREPDYSSWISIDRHLIKFIVYKRPFVDLFLQIVSQWYDLIVYSASKETYGNCVIDFLENKKTYFKKRFFRKHCEMSPKGFTKNLYLCSNDLSNVAIIDNSPVCYEKFQDNSIPISTWISDDCCDTALLDIIPFLDALRFTSDVRHILKRRSLYLNN